MRLRLLGAPMATLDDGREVAVPPGKPARLLAALALEPGTVLDRDGLVEAVWGDSPPASLRNALHVYVSRLRSLLGSDRIATAGTGYLLSIGHLDVDVTHFEKLLDTASAAEATSGADSAESAYLEALALYRGPLLAGESLSTTLAAARRRLHERHSFAREGLLGARLASASPSDAAELISLAREMVDEEPLREVRHVMLMQSLNLGGRTPEALEAYRSARALLVASLGLEPGIGLRRARAQLLSGNPLLSWTPLAAVIDESPRPALHGALIGRERELAALSRLVSERRLVTISGPGGVGKTRLALEIREAMSPFFAGRSALVDLATVSSPEEAERVVSEALTEACTAGIAGSASTESLRDAVGRAPTLLVLDSCEHVDVTPLVQHLTHDLPSLSVLTASRRPLGAESEVVVSLEGLAAGSANQGPDELRKTPGVSLYLLRAIEAAHPVDDDMVPEVATLVRKFDGLPLAIEIAAAHPDGGRPALLLDRPILELAEFPRRDARGRNRSLAESLAWSVDQLSPPAQRVLRALAELPPHTPEALAVDSASVGNSPARDATGLDELARWSLIRRPLDTRTPVVSLPESLADYVRSTLEPEERLDVHERIRASLARASAELITRPLAIPVTAQASAQVQALQSAALAALAWQEPWADPAARALTMLLLIDADLDHQHHTLLVEGLESGMTDDVSPDLRYDLHRARLGFALATSDSETVATLTERIRSMLPDVDSVRQAAWAVDSVFLALEEGRFLDADTLSEQAWSAAAACQPQQAPLRVRAARARMHATRLHRGLDEGVSQALTVAALAELADSAESISAFGEAAEILVSAGELTLGASYTRKAADRALRWNSPHSLVYVLSLADIALESGNLDEAQAIIMLLLERVRRRGDDRYQKWCLIRLALIAARGGDATRSATLLGASSTVSVTAGWESDPDVCDLRDQLPATLGGSGYRSAFDRGAAAPRGWVAAVLEEPVSLPTTLHPSLVSALTVD